MTINISRQKFLRTTASLVGLGLLSACGQDATSIPASPTPAVVPPTTGLSASVSATTASVTGPNVPTTSVVGLSPAPTKAPQPTNSPILPTTQPPNSATPGQTFSLDLAGKVGQRMLVVFPGGQLTPAIATFLKTIRPGGIVMFADNIQSLAQIKSLNAQLQALAADNGMPPFIITLDEEGGIVSRMPPEARESVSPAQMAQAAGGESAVRTCARETAYRLADLGFNLDLAPDADVNSNYENPVIGTRSFGSDPTSVAKMVTAALAEYRAAGVGACVKHFPGHGDTATDSHTGLPVVNKNRQALNATELVPFVGAIGAGVPAIMAGHILFPQLEPNSLPASLSPYFLKQVLRDELKFLGLILTDSLSMGAISQKYGLTEAARLALKAGADMTIATGDLNDQTAVFNTLVAAAKRGDFDLEGAVERILAFKKIYARPQPNRPANPDSLRLAAQSSITLLQSDGKTLPFKPGARPTLINFALAKPTQVEGQPPNTLLSQLWPQQFPGAAVIEVSVAPVAAEIARVNQAARQASALVIVTRDAFQTETQASLVQTLLSSGPPTVVVAVRGPYDLIAFSKAPTYLTTYSDVPVSLRALLTALTGQTPIQGHLPVAIPGLYKVGDGLQPG